MPAEVLLVIGPVDAELDEEAHHGVVGSLG